MVEVDLSVYGNILFAKTVSGEYVWEQSGVNKYRLVMQKGSIVIDKVYNPTDSNYFYEISFYGTTTLIYTGVITRTDSLFNQYSVLYESIVSKNNERINKEISELFG